MRYKSLLFVLVPLFFLFSCVHGKEDFSGNLLIKAKKNGIFYFCSAVAIKKSLLLTAAHCLDNAAEILAYNKTKLLKIKKFEKHPKYNRSKSLFKFDLGVIELASSLPSDVKIYSIANTKGHEPIIRVGFGGRKGKNKMTVIRNLKTLDFGNSFVKTRDETSVSGDSGGALFQKHGDKLNLVAIHSTIDGNLSFNPSLSLSDPWLKSKIQK